MVIRLCLSLVAAVVLAVISASRGSAAPLERTQSDPTAYWWYFGVSAAQVNQALTQHNARIVDLQVESVSPTGPVFTVAMVANSGPYAKQWWWWYGQSAQDVATKLGTLNARLISVSPYQDGPNLRFAAVMVSNAGADAKQWWWFYGSGATVGAQLKPLNARVVDLEPYAFNGAKNYAAIAIANTGSDARPWWWWFNLTGARSPRSSRSTRPSSSR
jgi:hypothetical protein